MKKLSLPLGLFILAVILCVPIDTSPQYEQIELKTEKQTEMPIVTPVELTRKFPPPKLPDSGFEPPASPQETLAVEMVETPETAHTEPNEQSTASTIEPEPTTEARPEKPPVKETASATPQTGSGLPGFDYVPNLGPNVVIYAEDMYENGNKIGIMGDINKQVGIMN